MTQAEIKHDYFTANMMNHVTWIPSKATQKIAQQLGLVFKSNHGKLVIYASSENENDKIVLNEKLRSDFCLTFYIQLNEPFWTNLTPISIKKGQVLYFSNKQVVKEKDKFLLHKSPYASIENTIEVTNGLKTLSEDLDDSKLKVNKVDSKNELVSYAIKTKNGQTYIDSRLLEEGQYQITDPNKETHFFLSKTPDSFDAICHLTYSNDWSNGQTIFNKDWTWEPVHFQLNFPTRETFWRYFIPKKSMTNYQGVMVVNEKNKVVFTPQEEVISTSGEPLICFTSQTPITIKQKLENTFQLKKNVGIENRSEGIIIGQLPGPEKETLFRMDKDGNRYSDIYINF